ncbi:MAG: hypothetical protein ABW352_14440 [Polyangiales bacterium]
MHRLIALLLLVTACSSDTTEPRPTSDAGGGGTPTARTDGGGFPSLFGDGGLFGGAGRQQCPAAKPSNGAACTEGRGDCMYGVDVCDCNDDKWACWNPASCPTAAPDEGGRCEVVGMQCSIEAQSDELDCDCTATGWDCGRQVCPAAEPTSGGSCVEGDGQCTFGARVCVCEDDVWACWNPADCPATPPAENATCSPLGMSCPYGRGECSCGEEGWECNRRVVRDAGVGDAGAAIVPNGLDSGV